MSRKPKAKPSVEQKPVYQDPPLAEYVASAGYDTGGNDEPKAHERYEHQERKAEAPKAAPTTPEEVQRAANHANHSERTHSGGKKLP